jgi:hypothetical protein
MKTNVVPNNDLFLSLLGVGCQELFGILCPPSSFSEVLISNLEYNASVSIILLWIRLIFPGECLDSL